MQHMKAVFTLRLWAGAVFVCLLFGLGAQSVAQLIVNAGDQSAIISHTYIETGLTYNHPSGITMTKQGSIIAATSCGAGEGEQTNICIYRKPQNASKWDRVETIKVGDGFDPQVYQPKKAGAPILLFYYKSCCEDQYMRTSSDDGLSWGSEIHLPSNSAMSSEYRRFPGEVIEGPEQNPPLEMPNGVLWASHWRRIKSRESQAWITVIPPDNYTGQSGTPWKVIQASTNGSSGAFMLASNAQVNGIYKDVSMVLRCDFHGCSGGTKLVHTSDGGKTWSDAVQLTLSNNIGDRRTAIQAGVTSLSLDVEGGPAQGFHMIAGAGDGFPDPNGGRVKRHYIRIAAANNVKGPWKEIYELRMAEGEQADPTFIQDEQRNVHLLWTGRGADGLRHIVFDPDKLAGNPATAFNGKSTAKTDIIPSAFVNNRAAKICAIALDASLQSAIEISVCNVYGKVVQSLRTKCHAGQILSFSYKHLHKGTYFLRVKSVAGENAVYRLIAL